MAESDAPLDANTKPYPHESHPVGKSEADQKRNAELLSGYDYGKYATALTGFTGQDLQRVGFMHWQPAVRTRVGTRGRYKAGFARLPDGTLVLASCRDNNQSDPTKRKFHIAVFSSNDEGLTWKEIGTPGIVGKEPCLTALPDGALILIAEPGYYGPGAKRDEHGLGRSEDGGRTWHTTVHKCNDSARNMIVEPDGSLLMVHAKQPDFHGEGRGSSNLLVGRSQDGLKWEYTEGLIDWDWTGFGEVSSIRSRDGRLLAALRRQIPGTSGEGFEDTVITESTDNGRTWVRPWQLLTTAQVHAYLTELADGRLLCTYSNYHVPFGVSAVLSYDAGKTWDLDNTIRLSTSSGYWVGWAVTLQLPDGDAITSYAATTYYKQPPDFFTLEVVRWKLPAIGSW